ncbi:hypothetical protein ABTX77_26995 [Streptomyces sp. NPDC097704]|uniref:hypothetical protein n=1 Tax=Streptomyces sp. NPDC097704 TaxID=3157101 RepID=UPI00332BCD3C
MAGISKVALMLKTAKESDAGTDGWVYLGIAGRELHVDTTNNDFEPGAEFTYVFGQDANVLDAERNDPTAPRLNTDDLDRFPLYIRFEPKNGSDNWGLDEATVLVNPGTDLPHRYSNPAVIGAADHRKIWLGQKTGKMLHLRRY